MYNPPFALSGVHESTGRKRARLKDPSSLLPNPSSQPVARQLHGPSGDLPVISNSADATGDLDKAERRCRYWLIGEPFHTFTQPIDLIF